MEFIADGLLIATGLTAGLYCLILSRRLRKLTDSGSGIGAQIESLDRALSDTRTALAETREGVGDLRASAKSAQAQLARDLALATDLAGKLEAGAAKAEAALQRLYQAENRLEAYQEQFGRGADFTSAETLDAPGPDAAEDDESDGAEHGYAMSITRVELPDGTMRQVEVAGPESGDGHADGPDETEDFQSALSLPGAGMAAARSGQGGRNLKVERMML